jgi:hypothetical protein
MLKNMRAIEKIFSRARRVYDFKKKRQKADSACAKAKNRSKKNKKIAHLPFGFVRDS